MDKYSEKILMKSRMAIFEEIRNIAEAKRGLNQDSEHYANCILQRLKQCQNDIDLILIKEGAVY